MSAVSSGSWVTVTNDDAPGWIGRVGRVDKVLDDGRAWVRGDGWRITFPVAHLAPCQRPDLPPWLTDDYATDVDGFLSAYAEDDNTFWCMDSGHAMNVIDVLLDRIDALAAQRDAARDIAVRLEGELARAAERASRESIRDVLRANLFDGSDEGLTTMPAKVFLDDASEVIADWLTTDPDAVIAEGES